MYSNLGFESDKNNLLSKRWFELSTLLKLTEDVSSKWFQIITQRYQESWRYYHTLEHIKELLEYEENFHHKLKNRNVVSLAIIFHDIIYYPKENDNEEKSAELFEDFSKEAFLNIDIQTKVKNLILATKQHKVTEINDTDLCFFLDFDLSVLGRDPHKYKEYSTFIRNEYIHYPDESYKKGRTSVLNKLMSQGDLFITQEFKQQYELKARQNMQNEIISLQYQL